MGKSFNTGTLINGLTVDSSGNVGLGGAANASYKLAVTGNIIGTGTAYDLYTSSGIGSSAASGLLRVVTAGTSTGIAVGQSNSSRYTAIQPNEHIIYNDDFFMRTNGAFPLSLGTNNTIRLSITSSGNIGIGTSAPVGPLDIAVPAVGSAIAATNAQQAYDYSRLRIKHYTDSNLGLSIGYAGANWTYIQACYNQGSAAPLSLNAFGGNVGIGTANTTGLLTLARNNNITINTSDGSDDGYLAICGAGGDGSGRGGHIYLSGNERGADAGSAILSAGNISNGFVAFRTGADIERVRITNGGNLRFSNVPTDNYQLDTSVAISIANGGTIPFPNFSGLVIVNNFVNGVCAMWLCGAGYTLLIGQSTSGATGVLSYTGGNGGYTWTSNYGSTANYGVFAVRTRPTA